MGRGRRCGVAGSWTVVLGAVIIGCAFFVPAAGAAAGITVDIIKPDKNPIVFDAGKEHEFEAVAFVEGQELPGGEVSWEWDFGDGTDHVLVNPTTHTFARTGNWTVTVTATYGQLSGQDALNAAAAAGGLLDAVEFLASPDTGGQVCDQVEVMWRVPWDELNDHLAIVGPVRIYRNNDGQWEEQYTYGRLQQMEDDKWYYVVSTWWDSCSDPNTAAVDWRVDYTLWVNEPPPPGEEAPYYTTVTDTKTRSWTPFNTVVKATPLEPIKHMKGDTEHTIGWTITHLGTTPAPTFDAHLQVLDMGGNEVCSHTVQCGIGGGSWDWHPPFGLMGQDADAFYTYKVTAGHGATCSDCDKAEAPSLQVDGFTASLDVPTMTATFTLDYHAAGGDVAEAKATIYDSNLGEIAQMQVGSGGVIPANTNLTAQAQVQLPAAGPWGTFHVVMEGEQTMEAGLANRDQLAKPLLPHGGVTALMPGISLVAGGGDWGTFMSAATEAAAIGLSDYPETPAYAVARQCASVETVQDALRNSAGFFYCGHANPSQIGDGTANNYYLETNNLAGHCGRLLVAVWYGCHTADYNAGDNWVSKSVAAGADCSIGWTGTPYLSGAPTWSGIFWDEFALGTSADIACFDAAWTTALVQSYWAWDIMTYRFEGDTYLAPTRYGE